MTTAQILAILLALPPHYLDTEQPEARGPRMHRIAVAVTAASGTLTCAGQPKEKCRPFWRRSRTELEWLLLAQGWHESRFAQHVHEGRCRPKECDRGRARSPWQLQPAIGVETWNKLGKDTQASTSLAALHAGRVLSRGLNSCRSLGGALGLYATGRTCNWPPATKRLRWMQRQRRKWGL